MHKHTRTHTYMRTHTPKLNHFVANGDLVRCRFAGVIAVVAFVGDSCGQITTDLNGQYLFIDSSCYGNTALL